MKKITTNVAGIVLPLLISLFLFSCRKDYRDSETAQKEKEESLSSGQWDNHEYNPHHHHNRRPFRGNFDTYYNFIPYVADGWTPPNPAPAWYPGGGKGRLTHLGACNTFFNQYATLVPSGLQTVAAPVNMFFTAQLAAAGLTVPNSVSTIFYGNHRQSVWCTGSGASTTTPVSATRIEFTSQAMIIGGTRNFAGAHGNFTLSGYFNPQNTEDAGYRVEGWICY